MNRSGLSKAMLLNLSRANALLQRLDVDSNIPLEENMVVNIETPYYELNTASYSLEKTFVITKTSARPLTKQERDEPFVV